MAKNVKEIIVVASMYMALNIGAGFTSGQEILQFFASYSWWSFLGFAFVFCIMAFAGESVIDAGYLSKDRANITVYEYFLGSKVSNLFLLFIPFLFYSSYLIMISGAGAVLGQYFKLPLPVGKLIAVCLSVFSVFFHFQKITSFIGSVGRVLALLIFGLSLAMISRSWTNFSQVSLFFTNSDLIPPIDSFYGSAILYTGTIVLASSQFLFELGKTLTHRSSGLIGVVVGTVVFVFVAAVINLAILLNIHQVYNIPIITLYFAEQISPIVAFALSMALFLAMYCSATTILWSVSNIIRKKFIFWKKRHIFSVSILGFGAMLLSAVSFSGLMRLIYPANGTIGLVFCLLIIIKNRYLVYGQTQINKE